MQLAERIPREPLVAVGFACRVPAGSMSVVESGMPVAFPVGESEKRVSLI